MKEEERERENILDLLICETKRENAEERERALYDEYTYTIGKNDSSIDLLRAPSYIFERENS